jgi:hypothetical protein
MLILKNKTKISPFFLSGKENRMTWWIRTMVCLILLQNVGLILVTSYRCKTAMVEIVVGRSIMILTLFPDL